MKKDQKIYMNVSIQGLYVLVDTMTSQMLLKKRLKEQAIMREISEEAPPISITTLEVPTAEATSLVNVSHLVIPAELALIIQALSG